MKPSPRQTGSIDGEFRNLEELRRKYCPDPIRVLFVGESPPAAGTFFYKGDSGLARYTKRAYEEAYGLPAVAMTDFLNGFKAAGCYLDDLCLEPVNRMSEPARRAACKKAVEPFVIRLRAAQPQAIVPVVRRIESSVRQSAEKAGFLGRMRAALPHPGMGNHLRYMAHLSRLIGELREVSILPRSFL